MSEWVKEVRGGEMVLNKFVKFMDKSARIKTNIMCTANRVKYTAAEYEF